MNYNLKKRGLFPSFLTYVVSFLLLGCISLPSIAAPAPGLNPYVEYAHKDYFYFYTPHSDHTIRYSTAAQACEHFDGLTTPDWIYTNPRPVVNGDPLDDGGSYTGCIFDLVAVDENRDDVYDVFNQNWITEHIGCPAGYTLHEDENSELGCYRPLPGYVLGLPDQKEDTCSAKTNVGNPCNVITGNKIQKEEAYKHVAISFSRVYNSSNVRNFWRSHYETKAYSPRVKNTADLNRYGGALALNLTCTNGWSDALAAQDVPIWLENTNAYYNTESRSCNIRSSTGVDLFSLEKYKTEEFVEFSYPTVRLKRANGNIIIAVLSQNGGWLISPHLGWKLVGNHTSGYTLHLPNSTEHYSPSGNLISIKKTGGIVETLAYNAQDQLISVTNHLGRQLLFTYNSNGDLETFTDPAGQDISYSYDDADRLAGVTYPDGKTRTYHYEDVRHPHALTGITDENGDRYATWTYDDEGRAISSEHANGAERTDLEYVDDSTTVVTDALGASRTYNFISLDDGSRKLSSITGDNCGSCNFASSYTYDNNGFIASETDFNGNITRYTRDDRGRVLTRIDAFGTPQERTTHFGWHPDWHLPTKITEPGRITDLLYHDAGNLLSRTITDTASGESRSSSFTYTALGLRETADGPRSDVTDVTTYTYDSEGNLSTVTNALGQVTQITDYDAHGNPLRIVDANGVETLLTYGPRQRLITRSVDGAVTTFDYDGVGQLTGVTLPNGSALTYRYDAAHRLTEIEDSLGNRLVYTLDAMGNRSKEEIFDDSDVLRRTQSQVFDALSQLKEVHGANGQLTEYQYDANGNRSSTTEAGLYSTLQQFDALDRLIKVTDADSGETLYSYDALDRLTSVTDPQGLTTTYSYNAFGDLIQQVSPDTGTTTYTYDKAGNRSSQTDARGITISYTYDALNRLELADYPGTEEDVRYHYDGSNYSAPLANGIGRLTGIEESDSTLSFRYDSRGNLTSDARVVLGRSYETLYQYDAADNLVSMTYPSGRVIDYDRNALGQITSATMTYGNTTTVLADGIDYLPFGPATQMRYGNGIEVNRDYDLDYRISQLTAGTVQDLSYSFDPRNNINAITDAITAGQSQSFSYDALSRLTGAQGSYGSLSYDYDAIGNRTRHSDNGVTDTYSYGANSHRLQQASSDSMSYDPAGHMTQKSNNNFVYNQAGRMTSASVGNATTSYAHNALGQRIIKRENGGKTTVFAYDAQGRLLGESYSNGNFIRDYVYLNGMPISVVSVNTPGLLGPLVIDILGAFTPLGGQAAAQRTDWLHPDHLGTPQLATDENGNPSWQASYRPFGQVNITQQDITLPLRFPGQYADYETGMSYNYFRDYDPEIGRYIQSDPIGLRGGFNTYGYGLQNPIVYTDSRGLSVDEAIYAGGEFMFLIGYGFSEVTCCDKNNMRVRMLFKKTCYGPSINAGFSAGAITGLSGSDCRPENYDDWFFEINGGLISVDIGLPTGEVSEIGIGEGVGGGVAFCRYELVTPPKVIGKCDCEN